MVAHVVGDDGQDYVVSVAFREQDFGNSAAYDAELSRVMPVNEGDSPDFNEGADAIDTRHWIVRAHGHTEALNLALTEVP
jgi:hypothetical protein